MGPRLLAVSLVPISVLARVLDTLRERFPKAEVTVLTGVDDAVRRPPLGESGEVLLWRQFRRCALLREVRRRRFDYVVVIHGEHQHLTGAYWKAVALALASGGKRRLFCQERDLGAAAALSSRALDLCGPRGPWAGGRGAGAAMLGGAACAAAQLAEEVYVAAMGLMLLSLVIIGVAVTDFTEALSRGWPAGVGPPKGKDRG